MNNSDYSASEISPLQTKDLVKLTGLSASILLSIRGLLQFFGGVTPGTFEAHLNTFTDPLVAPFHSYTVSASSAFDVPALVSIVAILVFTYLVYIFIGILNNTTELLRFLSLRRLANRRSKNMLVSVKRIPALPLVVTPRTP